MSTNVVTSVVRGYTVDTAFISDEPMGDYYETAIRKGGHNWIIVERWDKLHAALDAHNEWVKIILMNMEKVTDAMIANHDMFPDSED